MYVISVLSQSYIAIFDRHHSIPSLHSSFIFSGARSLITGFPGSSHQRGQRQEHPDPRPHTHNNFLLLRFRQTLCPRLPQSYHSFYQTKPALKPQPCYSPHQGLIFTLFNTEKYSYYSLLENLLCCMRRFVHGCVRWTVT